MAWTSQSLGAYQSGESLVVMASSRTQAAARRAIPMIYAHGFFSDGYAIVRGAGSANGPIQTMPTFAAIADRGYPVLSADLGGLTTWANDTAIARIDTLLAWAATNLAVRTDRVIIAGDSMGSFLAQAWAFRNATRVGALWLRAPGTRMAALQARNGTLGPAMVAAYGSQGAFDAAMVNRDPYYLDASTGVRPWRNVLRGLAPVTRYDYTLDDEIFPAAEVQEAVTATGALGVTWPGTHIDNYRTDGELVADWLDSVIRRRRRTPLVA